MIGLLRLLALKLSSCLCTYSGCWPASLGLAAAALLPLAPWQLRQAGTLRSGAPCVYSVSPLAGSAFAATCSEADARPVIAAAGTASATMARSFAMRFIRTPFLNCFEFVKRVVQPPARGEDAQETARHRRVTATGRLLGWSNQTEPDSTPEGHTAQMSRQQATRWPTPGGHPARSRRRGVE